MLYSDEAFLVGAFLVLIGGLLVLRFGARFGGPKRRDASKPQS